MRKTTIIRTIFNYIKSTIQYSPSKKDIVLLNQLLDCHENTSYFQKKLPFSSLNEKTKRQF